MAYNQQQQPQQQQFVLTGQMVNIDGQQVLQQPQYVTINQPAMAAANVVSETFDAPPVPKPQVKPFDPTDHDLDPNFRLTRFADLKG